MITFSDAVVFLFENVFSRLDKLEQALEVTKSADTATKVVTTAAKTVVETTKIIK